jgi:hypothetical protein
LVGVQCARLCRRRPSRKSTSLRQSYLAKPAQQALQLTVLSSLRQGKTAAELELHAARLMTFHPS